MPLRDTLTEIAENVEGGVAAIIMAYDGIPIDEIVVGKANFDVQLLTVEYAGVLKEIKRVVELIKAGGMEEVAITTSQLCVVMRVLSDELFVALIMTKDGNFGKGRHLLRLKSYDLALELG